MLLKKGKGPWDRIPFFFFLMIVSFFKSIVILIISYWLFSKCFSCFFYLGVHRGTGVVLWLFFFTLPLVRDSLSRLPPFDRKTLKNCTCSADPGLLNETKGSWFPLSCLSSYQNGWYKQTFFYNHINTQIRRFFSELVESKAVENIAW